MNSPAPFLSPSEAARQLGVSPKALRLYEQRGLVAIQAHPAMRLSPPVWRRPKCGHGLRALSPCSPRWHESFMDQHPSEGGG